MSGGPVPKSPAAPSSLAPPVEPHSGAAIWTDLAPSRSPEAGPVEAEQTVAQSAWKHAAKLALSLQKRFDEAMLKSLCSDLNIDFADLEGDDLDEKQIALVDHFQERNELDILEDAMGRAVQVRNLKETLPAPRDQAIMLFISYSHKDKPLREQFEDDLEMLKADGLVDAWYDAMILPGTDFDKEIREKLDAAHVILLLVSRPFLASRYIRNVEIPIAMDRHEKGEARVIPILLRPSPWKSPPWCDSFGRLQVLPRNERPVIKWKPRDDAFVEIYTNIRQTVTDFLKNMESSGEASGDGGA